MTNTNKLPILGLDQHYIDYVNHTETLIPNIYKEILDYSICDEQRGFWVRSSVRVFGNVSVEAMLGIIEWNKLRLELMDGLFAVVMEPERSMVAAAVVVFAIEMAA